METKENQEKEANEEVTGSRCGQKRATKSFLKRRRRFENKVTV